MAGKYAKTYRLRNKTRELLELYGYSDVNDLVMGLHDRCKDTSTVSDSDGLSEIISRLDNIEELQRKIDADLLQQSKSVKSITTTLESLTRGY